jgi:aminoglycoside phosphotransferase (APT) family kinase protein
LALMHTQFTGRAELLRQAQAAHLLTYNADYFRLWFGRAQGILQAAAPSRRRKAKHLMERLAPRYEQVIERLVALPVTLIHGEFYASNVLVQETADSLRVCPVDWEMAGVGPGLLDLAALTAGGWTDEQKTALALAYHAALPPDHPWSQRPEALLAALDNCHLHLAMQWLGWSPDWSPPPEHRRNWLREALRLAEKLGF